MTWSNRFILWGIFFSAVFCRRELRLPGLSGVSLGDILLAVMGGLIAFHIFTGRVPLVLPRHFSRIFSFWLWALLGGLFFALTDPTLFSTLQFFFSFVKLTFFAILFIFVITFFKQLAPATLMGELLNFLVFNGLIALGIVILASFRLPYGQMFLFWGDSAASQATMYYRTTGFVVAKGLFSEPSMLALFQCFGLGLIWLGADPLRRVPWTKYMIVIISILLSFSVTGYALLVAMVFLYILKSRRIPWLWFFLSGIAIGGVLLIPNVFTHFKEAISSRLFYRMMGGLDDSFSSRVLASWDIPMKVFFDSPFFGTGLGNLVLRYPVSEFGHYFIGQAENWNTLAYVLGTTGVIGSVFFLSFVFGDCPKKGLGILLCIVFFGNGGFLETFFWIQLALYLYVQRRPVDRRANNQSLVRGEIFLGGLST